MANNTYVERQALKRAYPKSKLWHDKVDRMTVEQVTAVYIRLRAQGKLGR